nr:cyclin-dependent protein kinase inhibitor SMR3 [Ziziphus jujuba var. spinosa]
MYSGFNQISFLNMSGSNTFLVKDEKKYIESDVLKAPKMELKDGSCGSTTALSCEERRRLIPLSTEGEFKVKEDNDNDDDDDDGFKTPTSLDHKIPETKQCPLAPRKPKTLPPPRKRKLSPSIREDFSEEVESIFSPLLLSDLHSKNKKARRDEVE